VTIVDSFQVPIRVNRPTEFLVDPYHSLETAPEESRTQFVDGEAPSYAKIILNYIEAKTKPGTVVSRQSLGGVSQIGSALAAASSSAYQGFDMANTVASTMVSLSSLIGVIFNRGQYAEEHVGPVSPLRPISDFGFQYFANTTRVFSQPGPEVLTPEYVGVWYQTLSLPDVACTIGANFQVDVASFFGADRTIVASLVKKSIGLYEAGEYNEALDTTIHPLMDWVVARDLGKISALFSLLTDDAKAQRPDVLPKHAQIWASAIALTRVFENLIPRRNELIDTARKLISTSVPSDEAGPLLRSFR
jgi:hypothetical protein